MANFNTHFSVALATSASLATVGLMLGVCSFFQSVALAGVGVLGGLLPDIDLDKSKVSQLVFMWVSVVLSSMATLFFYRAYALPMVETLFLWGGAFLLLRFGVFAAFARLTRHRGMVHSVPYMTAMSLSLVCVLFYVFDVAVLLSWLFGVFLWLGAMVHLLLDELFSVNIYGLRLKKSFGSAFKFFEYKRPLAYALLYLLLLFLWWLAPPMDTLLVLAKRWHAHFYSPSDLCYSSVYLSLG